MQIMFCIYWVLGAFAVRGMGPFVVKFTWVELFVLFSCCHFDVCRAGVLPLVPFLMSGICVTFKAVLTWDLIIWLRVNILLPWIFFSHFSVFNSLLFVLFVISFFLLTLGVFGSSFSSVLSGSLSYWLKTFSFPNVSVRGPDTHLNADLVSCFL